MCGRTAWRVLQVRIPSRRNIILQKTVISAMRPTPQVVLNYGRGSSIFCFLIKLNQRVFNINVTLCFRSSIMLYIKKKHKRSHEGLAELFHDVSKVKLVIEILNKIGFCISYNELQRTGVGLTNDWRVLVLFAHR